MPWLRFRFKGKQKAWIFVDDAGQPVVDEGRARMRYKVEDPREYSANPANLSPLPDAEPFTGEFPAAEAAPAKSSKSAGTKKRSKADKARALGDGDVAVGPGGVKVVERPAEIPTAAPPGVVLCFTDGACTGNPGPAGLGVAMIFGEHRKEIWRYLGNGTNNIAELSAIKVALESITDKRRPIHVYTDSKYSMGVLAKGWKAKANADLIRETREIMAQCSDLTLFKVLGHAGHPLNELADYLARRAIAELGDGEDRTTEPLDLAALSKGVPDGASAVPTVSADAASTPAAPPTRRGVEVVMKPQAIPDSAPPGVVLAFTDGACFGNPGPAGWAAVVAHAEEVAELNGYLGTSTNNIAELTAIQKVLESVEDRAAKIHIYTDSAYSIGVLGQGWKAKANQSLIAEIKALLGEFEDVTLLKVKGHAGHPLNERVDRLAKAAIDER